MKKIFVFLFVIIISFSCSNKNEHKESKKNILLGFWETEDFKSNIGGLIKVPFSDTMKIPTDRLCTKFIMNFVNDTTYTFKNEIEKNKTGKTQTGNYEHRNDSLILNKGQLDWVQFKIDSLRNDKIFLRTNYMTFFSIEKDTITICFGNNVQIAMKRTTNYR